MSDFTNDTRSITIKNAKIFYRNFSGRPGKYSGEGVRTFCVEVPNEQAAVLAEDGWNVRYRKARDPGDQDQAYISVSLNYNYSIPPEIYRVVGKKVTLLSQDNVGQLDTAEVIRVDLRIRPRRWGDNQIKAYVAKMYVTVEEDDLDAMYNFGDEEEDNPFV